MSDRRKRLRQRNQGEERERGRLPYESIDAEMLAALDEAESKAISPAADRTIEVANAKLTKTGLVIDDSFSTEDADRLGEFLMQTNESLQWWLGDWANTYLSAEMSNEEMGQVYADLAERFGMDNPKTLRQYAWVCRGIPSSLRRDDLSYSHHKEVVGRDDMQMLLQWASDNKASIKSLRDHIKMLDNPPALPTTLDQTDNAGVVPTHRETSPPSPLSAGNPPSSSPHVVGGERDENAILYEAETSPIADNAGVVPTHENNNGVRESQGRVGLVFDAELINRLGAVAETLHAIAEKNGNHADMEIYENAMGWCYQLARVRYEQLRTMRPASLERYMSDALVVLAGITDNAMLLLEDMSASPLDEVNDDY